jgi:polyisoprenoid-binding protein YceI
MTDPITDHLAARSTADPSVLPLLAGTWHLDRAHSSIDFSVRHLGISKVRGRFRDFDAVLHVGSTLAACRLEATVTFATIDTGNADRDAHLQAPDLIDVGRRPVLRFESTGIRGDSAAWAVEGIVSVGEVSAPLTWRAELGGVEVFPVDGRRHAGFTARGALKRSELGLRFGPLDAVVGDQVTFELDVQFVEPS